MDKKCRVESGECGLGDPSVEPTLFSLLIRGDGLGFLREPACRRRDTAGARGDHSPHVELEMGHNELLKKLAKAGTPKNCS